MLRAGESPNGERFQGGLRKDFSGVSENLSLSIMNAPIVPRECIQTPKILRRWLVRHEGSLIAEDDVHFSRRGNPQTCLLGQ